MSRRLRINIFTAVLVIFMIFATGTIFQRYIKINNVQKDRSVRADMLLIQGVAKVKKSKLTLNTTYFFLVTLTAFPLSF